jgi:hypothetical protein
MNKVYLIANKGREDYYSLIGTKSDLNTLVANEKGVEVYYPGSSKEVYFEFISCEEPLHNEEVIKETKKNMASNRLGLFVVIPLIFFLIFGIYQFVKKALELILP